MIVLDTNVISEMAKPRPKQSASAGAWLEAQLVENLCVTSVTYAELLAGLYVVPDGKRRRAMVAATDAVVMVDLDGRILPFDAGCAGAFARISAERRVRGLSTHTADLQIAAIAMTYGAAVATRNVADFGAEGLVVINPWDHPIP